MMRKLLTMLGAVVFAAALVGCSGGDAGADPKQNADVKVGKPGETVGEQPEVGAGGGGAAPAKADSNP